MEQSSKAPSPPTAKAPIVLNSTEASGNKTEEMKTLSSIATPERQIVTIDSDSKKPTIPYGFGRLLLTIPPSLNDLNLPHNPCNILATNPSAENHEEYYSPQSPEPSEPLPISQPPMNLSTIEGWETPHTTTDDNTFYSDDESRRILISTIQSFPPTAISQVEKKIEPKKECRSPSVRLVDSRSLNRRASYARRQQIKTQD